MNYEIIHSGSDGNCTIVNGIIAIDCGLTYKKLKNYFNTVKIVLLTHIHHDHFNKKAIQILAENHPSLRFGCCEWLVQDLIDCGVNKKNIDIFEIGQKYDYGLFQIIAVKLYHDVPQCGYRLFMNGKKLIYATDTRTLDGIVAKNYDVYLVEGNYENEEELHERAYNSEYEARVKNTHLSREYTTKWLLENMNDNSVYEFMHKHVERGNKTC